MKLDTHKVIAVLYERQKELLRLAIKAAAEGNHESQEMLTALAQGVDEAINIIEQLEDKENAKQ